MPQSLLKNSKFNVKLHQYAVDYYRTVKNYTENSNNKTSRWHTIISSLDKFILEFLPHHALRPELQLKKDLHGIYRKRIGRMRLFWIAKKDHPDVHLIFIGNRKDGDKKDAYALLTKCVRNGDFDHIFEEVGTIR